MPRALRSSSGFSLESRVQSTFESRGLIGMCETLPGCSVDARGYFAVCRFGRGGVTLLYAVIEAFDCGAHV